MHCNSNIWWECDNIVKTLQDYGALLDKEIAYYERKMEEKTYFRRKKDQKYSKEEIQYILIGLRQAKNILTAYVMLPEWGE